MSPPRGLIEFLNTPVGREYKLSIYKDKSVLFGLNAILTIIALQFVDNWTLILAVSILIIILQIRQINSLINIPLAVNLNHPFMETLSVSDSELMINFSDSWINPGNQRLKMVKDPLTGWVLHKQDEDISILCSVRPSYKEKVLAKHLVIVNQAISLNNAVNETNDEFEDARDRETQDSTLLEREWLPEEEFDVQGPLSRIFSPE
ncbi:MAG: hypothetical protein VX366_01505 [Candidatus Thermoplasmatota archaeon]|nr:hypothetical protein [Euryarchaeota archaeon]MEE2984877.1 hypothetical protein [Candidatus Thermoplasmatota archaeon]|tara:strand:- start:663 stop:1277 length:615 start_codon:yes stop_codon:yes gene_type:complete